MQIEGSGFTFCDPPNKILTFHTICIFTTFIAAAALSSVQFHQHFISAFAPISMHQKSLTYTSSTKKLCTKLSYEKVARKMLVKLIPVWWWWHENAAKSNKIISLREKSFMFEYYSRFILPTMQILLASFYRSDFVLCVTLFCENLQSEIRMPILWQFSTFKKNP